MMVELQDVVITMSGFGLFSVNKTWRLNGGGNGGNKDCHQ